MDRLIVYMQALRNNWWIVVVTAAVAAVGTLLLSYMLQPVYQTRLQMLIIPNMSEFAGRDLIYSLDTLDRRSVVATYVEVIGSNRIRREAFEEMGLTADEGEAYGLTAVALPEASVLEIAATGPDPQMTAALANLASTKTIEYVSQTYDIYRLEQLDAAPVPRTPISPTPWRDAFLASIIGAVLGGALAILRDQLREPLSETLRLGNRRDPATQAFKRSYMEQQLGQILPSEAEQLVMGIVRLEGMPLLELPSHLERGLMRRAVRIIQDELPGRDLVGRWDEHSLAVIMRHIASLEHARRKLERLQEQLSQPIEVYPGGELVRLSPRLGAVVGHENDTVSTLTGRLMVAMVKAEKNGHEPLLYRQELAQLEGRPHEEVQL